MPTELALCLRVRLRPTMSWSKQEAHPAVRLAGDVGEMGQAIGGSFMSVALPYWGLSNPMPRSRVIAIVVILVLSPVPIHVLNDVVDLVTRLAVLGGLGTAMVYRNCHNRI
ncbi:hypothetical protein [Streptomyces xanthochromogenes]|uniref:hypothetical protein n=1 Tax=Streptomyces xanthochromogenes TaxID=67384 RepID=UPI00341A896A